MDSNRPMMYLLNDDGAVVPTFDAAVFGRWFETADRQLAETFVVTKDCRIRISTAFLGLDHAFEGEPVLWETMVFGSRFESLGGRARNPLAALRIHRKAVADVRSSLDLEPADYAILGTV